MWRAARFSLAVPLPHCPLRYLPCLFAVLATKRVSGRGRQAAWLWLSELAKQPGLADSLASFMLLQCVEAASS
jgi:hypothetical protein